MKTNYSWQLLTVALLACILDCGPVRAADAGLSAQRFADYQAITAVLKQYIVAIDTNDENLYGAAFAEKDALFEIRDVVRHGREEIKLEVSAEKDARAARIAKGEAVPPQPVTWHVMSGSNIVFLAGDRAKHSAYYQVWTRQNDHPGGVVRLTTPITLVAIGRYDDELADGSSRSARLRRIHRVASDGSVHRRGSGAEERTAKVYARGETGGE
jgi:SnoaL-like domain